MNHNDAASILGLAGEITSEMVDKAYRKLAMKFHPDRNPAGAEMMKALNEAREALRNFAGTVTPGTADYGDLLNDAINAIVECAGLEIEVCGTWVWVGGDTVTHKATIKEAGYRWASKKKMWYFRPDSWKSKSRGRYTIDEIRDFHGSEKIQSANRQQIAA